MTESEAPLTSVQDTATAPSQIDAARSVAEAALPFSQLLINRLQNMTEDLRNGADCEALTNLSDSASDLEDFLTFIVIVSEMLEVKHPSLYDRLLTFRKKMLVSIEALHPALSDLDLVEVADTLEHDVVSSLREYGDLHNSLQEALNAA